MHLIRLVHPCRTVVILRAGHHRSACGIVAEGSYYDFESGEPVSHCPGCGEWLGSAFVAARTDWEPSPHTTARCGQ